MVRHGDPAAPVGTQRQRGRSGRAGGSPATVALDRAGCRYTLHPYPHDPRASAYGEEAAAALGVDRTRILKTLVVDVDGQLVVGVVPVSARLDLKAVAAAVGGKRATMADVGRVERSTGYVVGGISPLGQRTILPTLVDATAAGHPTVYVSAGRRGLQVELSPDDLLLVTGARLVPLGRPD